MALIHGRSAEGEEAKSTNPVLIGAKDINGNAILLTTDAEGKLRVATDLEIASVTATDVTIHDPTTPGNKLKINADGSLPVQLSGSITSIASAPVVGSKTVTATAAELFAGASVKANRRKLIIRNEDPVLRLRIGPSGVTQQNGYPIEPGGTLEIQFDPGTAVAVYGISEGVALNVSVMEV